jgi:hypothetical protein
MSRFDAETLATLRQLLIEATFGPTWPRNAQSVILYTPDPIRWPDESKLDDELWLANEMDDLTLKHCFQLTERALVNIEGGWSPPPFVRTLQGAVELIEDGGDIWVDHGGERLDIFAVDPGKGWALTLRGLVWFRRGSHVETPGDEETLDASEDELPPRGAS